MSFAIDRRSSAIGIRLHRRAAASGLLDRPADAAEVRDVIAKSMAKQPLSVEETAVLLAADDPASVEQIFAAARQLKRDVYGNRIVLFAPLYIGNECTNDCQYCALPPFESGARSAARSTTPRSARRSRRWSDRGHKRTILVFGEHPRYTPGVHGRVRAARSIRCRSGMAKFAG